MKKQSVLLTKQCIWVIFSGVLVLMLIGSFFDYSISSVIHNEQSVFGILFAAFGEYPAALGFTAAGTLLWIGHNRENKVKAVLQGIGAIMLIFFGTMMAILLPMNYLSIPSYVVVIIGLICSMGAIFTMLYLGRNANRKTILQIAAVLFWVIFVEMLLVNLIKIPWGRPRMRLVAVDPRACFTPWWQAGRELKDTLVAAGVAAEEFKSFPSGHVANAAILLLLGILPMLNQKLASKKVFLVGIGLGWVFLVALSRIIMGAHYLTDTVMGFVVTLSVMLLICKIIVRIPVKKIPIEK